MASAAILKARARRNKWAAAHPEMERARHARWVARNLDRMREYRRAWKKRNKDNVRKWNRISMRRYHANHRDWLRRVDEQREGRKALKLWHVRATMRKDGWRAECISAIVTETYRELMRLRRELRTWQT